MCLIRNHYHRPLCMHLINISSTLCNVILIHYAYFTFTQQHTRYKAHEQSIKKSFKIKKRHGHTFFLLHLFNQSFSNVTMIIKSELKVNSLCNKALALHCLKPFLSILLNQSINIFSKMQMFI